VHPNAMLKHGDLKKIKLRLETNVVSDYAHLIHNPKTITSLSPVETGAKVFLVDEKGLRAQNVADRTCRPDLFQQRWLAYAAPAPSFRFTMQNSLMDIIALGYNVDAEWDAITTLLFGFTHLHRVLT
jgi:hypothetical protein